MRFGKPDRVAGLSGVVVVFLPFAFAYFLSHFYRTINAVLGPRLMDVLSLTAADLGLLTSTYFLMFAVAQLPVGMALDRYGARRVQLSLLAIATIGAVLFSQAQNLASLVASRALIGLGTAACFMAAMKALAAVVPQAKHASVNGALLAVGGLGAMAATVPVELALQWMDWRATFLVLAFLTALAALAIFALPPGAEGASTTRRVSLRSFGEVWRDRGFQYTVAVTLIPHAVFLGVQGLWMGNWLHDAVGLDRRAMAGLLFYGMAATVVGSLATGVLTQWLGRFGIRPLDVAATGVLGFVVVQLAMALDFVSAAVPIAILFPLLGRCAGLNYTVVGQLVAPTLTGRASTSLNLLIFVSAFLVQWGFGAIVSFWPQNLDGTYPSVAYQYAFGSLIMLQLPGLMLWCATKLRPRDAPKGVGTDAR